MSEKKDSKLSLSAKAEKFDVPVGTLKKVYKRGVAAWNSGHRPGTTPQQWGHARVNSFLRKGKTYHTADKDLREDAEQLNELDVQTYNKYIEATYSQTPAAQARKLGGPKHAQRTVGRLRARILKQKQINKPEYQEKLAQIRREHEALHNPTSDPSGRGYGQGRYMGDHVEHDADINKLFEMQLVGTDEYRKHAIAMTPGQDQEIEYAFPTQEYDIQTTEEQNTTDQSDGSVESGTSEFVPMSFRAIRKKLQEEEIPENEEEEIEDEEELEDDGAEDGVDFTPTLKTKKIKNTGPYDYGRADSSGLPILSTNLAEAIEYHKTNNISLVENIYRPGSEMFFEMLFEAKRLYAEGAYTPKDEYEQDLLESDIGEVAEYEGQSVLLDFPFEEELDEACWSGYEQQGMKKRGKKMVPNCVPVNEEVDQINETMNTIYPHQYHGSIGPSDTGDHVYSFYVPEKGTSRRHTYSVSITNGPGNPDGKTGNLSFDYNGRQPKSFSPITGDDVEYLRMHTSGDVGVTGKGGGKASAIISTVKAIAQKHAREYGLSNIEFGANWLEPSRTKLYDRITNRLGGKNIGIEDEDSPYVKYSVPVNEEGDPTHGKGIGKPFRSRGGGAVYVKNEKGNVIKVNFSQSGMKKRFNEPARVKSFVARHNCYGNKDKTSASYWACRWPRYFSDSGQQWW